MNRTRQVIAGLVIAGAVTFASAGIASAQTTTPTNPGTTTGQSKANRCDKAKARLPQLEAVKTNSEQRLAQVNQRIAAAQAQHRDAVVKRLEARRDQLQKRHDKVVDAINKINARCGS